jgi:hypothetical protein
MLDQDLSRRIARLLRGERRCEDLDRLFLALRDRPGARSSVREIGDFIAHRDKREKGPVTQKARDIFISLQSWVRISVMGEPFTLADIRRVAEANLRIATDEQLAVRLGLKRALAKSVLTQALKKIEQGREATSRERRTVDYLGSAFIWNPAFTDTALINDLEHMLGEAGLLRKPDRSAFGQLSEFIALYTVTLMHGSAVVLENGDRVQLVAGFDNDQRRLEVKATLTLRDMKKPVSAATCLFWTTLAGVSHCSRALLEDEAQWDGPLQLDTDGRLTSFD